MLNPSVRVPNMWLEPFALQSNILFLSVSPTWVVGPNWVSSFLPASVWSFLYRLLCGRAILLVPRLILWVVLCTVAFLMFSVKESEPSHLDLFPPIITSCVTVIKYQNQQSDIGRIHRDYLNFNSFTCTYLCVYVDSFMQFYHMCRFIWMTPQSRYKIVSCIK